MNELLLATSNSGKIKELQAILAPIRCIPQSHLHLASPEETGLSFVENALIKARYASLHANKPALADDSGLVVPALQGEPGIYSARYAGQQATDTDNLNLLLKKMQSLHGADRDAYFYCAIALVMHAQDPTPIIATGIIHGSIAAGPSGKGGFGYDPIFFLPQYQCTAAELEPAIKNTISHRALALAALKNQLQ